MDQNPIMDQILKMDQNWKKGQNQKWIKIKQLSNSKNGSNMFYKKGSTPIMDQNPIMDQILKMDQKLKKQDQLPKMDQSSIME